MHPAEKLLHAAAAPTLERIRQDKLKAPTQLQPLLDYLEANLFDPDLDANQLRKACGIRDNSLPIYFHHALALPPYAYIEDCRLEVACRLLCDTKLKVWQIGQLLGYSTLQVFSRAFARWSGLRPSVFRRHRAVAKTEKVGKKDVAENSPPPPSDGSLICLNTLRKAVTGSLGSHEADDLALQLLRLYPESFGRAGEALEVLPKFGPAQTVALDSGEAWELLRHRPREEQLRLVKKQWRLASVELFEELVNRSIDESRNDVHRGVEIAHLALDCLEELQGSLGEEEYRKHEVKGCAWLANAHRLASDLSQAEQWIARGDAAFDDRWAPEYQWDLILVKSATRLTQRRLEEALELADQVVRLVPYLSQPEQKMRSWLHKMHVKMVMGCISEALEDLQEAHDLVYAVNDKYLCASFYQSLCYCLALEGKHQEAVKYLPVARSLFQEMGLKRAFCYLEWTEGQVHYHQGMLDSAASYLRKARSGFYDTDQIYLGAMVSLDLAILYASESRISETLDLVAEVIKIFDELKVKHEALKAIQLLRQVAAKKELSLKTLQGIRSVFVKSQPSSM